MKPIEQWWRARKIDVRVALGELSWRERWFLIVSVLFGRVVNLHSGCVLNVRTEHVERMQ